MLENIVQNAHCDEVNSTAMVWNHVNVHMKFGLKLSFYFINRKDKQMLFEIMKSSLAVTLRDDTYAMWF